MADDSREADDPRIGTVLQDRYRIVARGPIIETYVNGVRASRLMDDLRPEGFIALQVHGGGDYTKQFVRYRNIRVTELK